MARLTNKNTVLNHRLPRLPRLHMLLLASQASYEILQERLFTSHELLRSGENVYD